MPFDFILVEQKSFASYGSYKKFTNWLIGEFDLYLTMESEHLQIYFPNGWFSLRSNDRDMDNMTFEITVKSKTRISCNKIMQEI